MIARFSTRAANGITLKYFQAAFSDPSFYQFLGNSLMAGVWTIAITLSLTTFTLYWAYLKARWLLPLLEIISLLPFVVPAVTLGIGLIQVFTTPPLALTGTPYLLVGAYTVVTLPFAYRAIENSLQGALFEWLRSRQIKIALTTGFYREVTNIILYRLGWNQNLDDRYIGSKDSLIQASITPSEIYHSEGRPAPFMLQKAMYRLGIRDPQTVMNIGDTPSDIESGFHANCLYSFEVTHGTHTHEELSQYLNDGLFSSLVEFQEKLAHLI